MFRLHKIRGSLNFYWGNIWHLGLIVRYKHTDKQTEKIQKIGTYTYKQIDK